MLTISFQQISQVTQSLMLMQDTIIAICKADDNDNKDKRKLKLNQIATALE